MLSHYTPTIFIVSHDLRRLLPRVERVLGLFDGQFVLDARLEEVRTKALPAVQTFLSARFDLQTLPLSGETHGAS